MKNFKFTYLLLCIGISWMFTACAESDDYSNVEPVYEELTATKTIEEVFSMADSQLRQFTEEDVLEGYVSSSDEGGTFYKTISIQNLEKTRGFSISVDMYNIYTEAEPGRKIYIKLQDLYYTIKDGALVIGAEYEGTVGRLRPQDFQKHVAVSAETVSEEDLLSVVNISTLKNNQYINMLVQVEEVQFAAEALGKTFYDSENDFGGNATNHNIEDSSGNMIFRTSSFAKFANQTVPSASGKLRGVLTKFGSTFQFFARTFDDIMLTDPYVHIPTHQGGTDLTYQSAFVVNFEGYNVDQSAFPELINDYIVGGRYWQIKSFSNNKYAQMTSFGANADVKAYLIVPVGFTGSNTISFQTKDGHNNGDVLSVYYALSDSYAPGDLIQTENFTNITDNFTIASGTATGYAQYFTDSGEYTVPSSVTGNGYLVFEYSGSQTVTTTIQVDNITVTE